MGGDPVGGGEPGSTALAVRVPLPGAAHSLSNVRFHAARISALGGGFMFLRRYVIWCAKARRFDRLRNAVDLLMEVGAARRSTSNGRLWSE